MVGHEFTMGGVSVLLTGSASQVKAWGRRQHPLRLSCRRVLQGRSPEAAQDFARIGLKVVHRALDDLDKHVAQGTQSYLLIYLHEAIVTALLSRWIDFED